MRILIIAPFGSGFLADSYAAALEGLGHEITRFDSDEAYFGSAWRARNRWTRRLFRRSLWDRVNLAALDAVRETRPQLALAFKAPFMDPETVRLIRRGAGVPIVNYYSDNPYCGVPLDPRKTSAQRPDIIACLREYTRVFTWGREIARRLQGDGVAAARLPFGTDSKYARVKPSERCDECGKKHEVVFLGQENRKRRRHVAAIRRNAVAVWGRGWKRARRTIGARHRIHTRRAFGEKCAAIVAGADVALNIVDDLNIPGHNMRTFEIPASGGVMLSTYTEEQAEFFPEGEAAWYYRDPAELDGLIERLLAPASRDARERTRERARQIARDHTYEKRAESLLKILEE